MGLGCVWVLYTWRSEGLGKCNLKIFLKVAKVSPQQGWKRGGREAPGSSRAAGTVSPEGQGPALNFPEVVQAQLTF